MKKIALLLILIMTLYPALSFADYENTENMFIIETDGNVYLKDDCNPYTETGIFTDAEFVGYNNNAVRISSGKANDSVLFKTTITPDYYEIYYWKSVFEDGDPNAYIDFIATGSQNGRCDIDFSKGMTGWQSIGIYFCHDGAANLTVVSSGDGKIPATAMRLVKRNVDEYNAYRIFVASKNVILMKINSRNSICNMEKMKIPDTAPMLQNDITFVPIRFVSENMKGDVFWDGNERTVLVELEGHNIKFYIDSTVYTVDGVEYTLDSAPFISNDRTMIPIRALSEGAGKKVVWEDNGLIIICDELVINQADYESFVKCAGELLDNEI